MRGLGVGFSEGLVGGGCGPTYHHQENIQDEESYGDVVEDGGLVRVSPALIERPEEKCDGEQDRFEPLFGRGQMDALVDEVGDGDHGEREGTEEVVSAGGKERWGDVPEQECGDPCERDDSEEDG